MPNKKLIKVPGKSVGSYVYLYEDYSYALDKRRNKKKIYRCSTRSTTHCTATLTRDKNGVIQTTSHNHKAEVLLVEKRRLIKKMIQRVQESSDNVKTIFNEVCRSKPAVGKHLSFRSLRSRLEKARAKQRPKIPHSVLELHDFLKDYEPLRGFYQGVIKSKGKYGLVFSSNTLLEALGEALQLFMDGTFAGIAAVFLLTEKRTAGLYEAMWRKFFELVPRVQENVTFIMSDYERAAGKAARCSFPNARICGCWFHFCQALRRRWEKLHLMGCPRTILWDCMSLALAPPSYFKDALKLLHSKADELIGKYPAIKKFLSYFKKTWVIIAEQVSVYGSAIRTNNSVESFHSTAKERLGGVHPNVWRFFDKLKEVILDQELTLARIMELGAINRPRLQANRDRDTTIKEKQVELVSGRISLDAFLGTFHEMHREMFD